MRLIVLDTNVIVSAGIRVGTAPAVLVMDWILEGQVQVVTCPSIVAEYREVAGRPKFRSYGFPPFWLKFLIEESLHLPEPQPWSYPAPDPSDTPFLALAHAAGAWLITGNRKHFPASIRHGVTVLSPADYLICL
jgi:putative PIN family toxin of toxin-antitoxin system